MSQWCCDEGDLLKQYIKGQRCKQGIKFYELTTNDGYALKVSIGSGKRESDDNDLGR